MNQDLQVLLSHENVEWYTPPEIVELVIEVLGEINLDPASHAFPQRWIQADDYFTMVEDGLKQNWFGRVFLNPPYSKTRNKSNQEIWATKLISEFDEGRVEEAILLVKAVPGYVWFDNLLRRYPCCFKYGLIEFVSPNGKRGKAKAGSAFFYFGTNIMSFHRVFKQVGKIC